MTIQEASIRFQIEPETLQFYLENELLTGTRTEDGIPDYKEEDLQRAVQFCFLLKSGMDIEEADPSNGEQDGYDIPTSKAFA